MTQDEDAIGIVPLLAAHRDDPLAFLERGLAGLRRLSAEGLHESRAIQERAFVIGLLELGRFGEVAEAMAERLVANHGTAEDREILNWARSVRLPATR